MKTILKLSVLTVVVAAAVGFFIFPEKIKLYAGTGKRLIQEKIEEAQGLETKLALVETRVCSLDREINRLNTEMVRRQVDVEYLEDLVSEKVEAHENLRRAMKSASELLAEGRENYKINGRTYTHAEVSRDASEKLKIFRIQSETIDNLNQTLNTKKNTLQMARENVVNAESIKGELIAKVRFLKADLEKFKAKEVFAETKSTGDLTAEFKTEIGKTQKMLADFEKQLNVKERILDERIRINGDFVGGIDYTSPRVIIDEDVAAAIEACLQSDV